VTFRDGGTPSGSTKSPRRRCGGPTRNTQVAESAVLPVSSLPAPAGGPTGGGARAVHAVDELARNA